MRINFKRAALAAASVFLILSLVSCGLFAGNDDPKTFSKEGMSITLTGRFSEENVSGQTFTYASDTYVVLGLKETFESLESKGGAELSLFRYAELVLEANGLEREIHEEDGLTYFDYTAEADEQEYAYLACVFRSEDAFWLVQFACRSDMFEESMPAFVSWAKTVEFN